MIFNICYVIALCRNIREKLLFALTRDKAAGGPFKMFLDRYVWVYVYVCVGGGGGVRVCVESMLDRCSYFLIKPLDRPTVIIQFLCRHRDYEMLSNLQFWEDVEAYAEAEDRAADRLVRMGHAWAIYNTYMSVHATYPIGKYWLHTMIFLWSMTSQSTNVLILVGISAITRDCLHKTLLTSQDFVDVSVFKPSKEYAVASLERLWIRYLKEDMKAFIE